MVRSLNSLIGRYRKRHADLDRIYDLEGSIAPASSIIVAKYFPKVENLGVQNFDTISFFPKRSIIWMHRVVGKCRPMAPLRFFFANLTSKIPLVSWLNPGCMT